MQLKTLSRPGIAVGVTAYEVRKLVQSSPFVVRAEKHLPRLSDHPSERMRRLATCAGVVVNAHPLQFALGTRSGFCQKLKRRAPERPGGNSEATHRANLEGKIKRPLRRMSPTTCDLDAIHAAHEFTLSRPTYWWRTTSLSGGGLLQRSAPASRTLGYGHHAVRQRSSLESPAPQFVHPRDSRCDRRRRRQRPSHASR